MGKLIFRRLKTMFTANLGTKLSYILMKKELKNNITGEDTPFKTVLDYGVEKDEISFTV